MQKVFIKGRYQYLLTLDEDIPDEVMKDGKNLKVEANIPNSVRDFMIFNPIRPLLVYSVITDVFFLSFVFWYTHNAESLNEHIKATQNNEEYETLFKETVILAYQKTVCYGDCGKWWDTLILPHDSVASRPYLNEIALDEYVACPECGGSFRQPVVIVVGEAEPEED